MSIDEVSKEQAKMLVAGLYPGLHYLARLRERMEKAGFRPPDPLFVLVSEAYDTDRLLYGKACDLSGARERFGV